MNRGNNREGEDGAEKSLARNVDPAEGVDLHEHDEEDGGDLSEGVGFAEDAGAEVAKSRDGVEHGAGGENGNVAAEDENGELPGNSVQNREHEKGCAEQEFVGDGIEILAEQGFLIEGPGEETIEPVAESGDNEKNERPFVLAIHEIVHDEGQEHHAQQGELVGESQQLREPDDSFLLQFFEFRRRGRRHEKIVAG